MADKITLGTIFSRFTPDTESATRIFENSNDARISGDREKKMYEVHFTLPSLETKKALYELEEKLAACYCLAYIRLLPKYPPELFSLD